MFKARRHHADDFNRFSVELNLSSDDGWVAGKAARPETIAQHDHVVSARLKLFRFEYTAVSRRDSHHRKEIRGCGETEQAFRCLSLFGQITAGEVISRHLLEHR